MDCHARVGSALGEIGSSTPISTQVGAGSAFLGALVMHMKLDIFLFGCWAMWGSIVKCVNLCSNDHDP